jgi:glyoxylase-like metal-dependent hydrolase (beta-lactamase superfamily II)
VAVTEQMPVVVPLEVAEFDFPDPELAGRTGVVVAYAIRHADGVVLFDTGFGFGNSELDATYHPRSRRIDEVLAGAGIEPDAIDAVVNCHLHADHAGQNGAFPGVPIYVQPLEWEIAHTTDHTILEWIDVPGIDYRQVAGDYELRPGIRVIATPGHTPGHQSMLVETSDGRAVLAGQAVYSLDEWTGNAGGIEGRSSAPDRDAYDRSVERLRALEPDRVLFGHDRRSWVRPGAA